MDRRTTRNAGFLTAAVAVGTAGLLMSLEDAMAGPKGLARRKRAAVIGRTEVPLGLQGTRGAGQNVVIPFTLIDPSRAATDVEAQFGVDVNGDGSVTEDEYRPATEDRLDSRDTRKNRKPQLFVTSGDIGATHAYVWRSTADIASGRHETLLYQYTDQGRLIPDPAHPGEFLFDQAQAGVRIRLRAVRGKGATRVVGEWAYTDAFSVNNNNIPAMTIDQVLPNASGTASDEDVEVLWTARDPDSEDANSNGTFDAGEDRNGNGSFDQEQVGAAFDYYRLQPGEDPSTMTDEQLGALTWLPCTRAAGKGDTDSFRENAPGVGQADKRIFATPNGRQWRFVWNSIADVGTVKDLFILRARPVDSKKENGDFVYQRSPFTLDNWKVFSSAAAGNPDINMAAARSGCTVTNLVYGLEQSDASYGKPFQQMIVAGGANASGTAVRTVDVFLVNSETADTTTATSVGFVSFTTARRFHTATMLQDGRVLFAGGFDSAGNPTNTTEIYDPATRTMAAGPVLNTPRARHTAVLLSTGDVAFIGGVGVGSALLASVEVYPFTAASQAQPATMTTLAATLSVAQHSASAVVLPDQTVLITGGISGAADATGNAVQTAQLLDPLAGPVDAGVPGAVKAKSPSITTVGSMGAPRKFAGVTSLLDGNVLFSGGFTPGTGANASMELFNWKTRAFEAVTVTMPDGGRSQHVATLLGDGTVVLAGGATNDPAGATVAVTGKADVFQLGARNDAAQSWTGTFLEVNGDMVAPRRGADAAVTMNGRTFIAGGQDAVGQPIAKCEVYVPEGSRNTTPKVHVYLPSSDLSHAFGAPVYYRLVDAELDQARIQAQFRVPGGNKWYACTTQSATIGGDYAEDTAGLATTNQDLDFDALLIDPIAKNTVGDHIVIWSMSSDIDRPLPGQAIQGYNIRVIPFGAVRGPVDVTDPVRVLYNTKAITTILPLEDSPGVPNPYQGGDIRLTVHVRDIDGAGNGPRNGDPTSVFFEYAVDANGDGLITAAANEFFTAMSPAKKSTNFNTQTNPVAGVLSWSEAYDSPASHPATRPTTEGWVNFDWDALYDIGPPSSPTFEARNIWVRVTATDNDPGFPKLLRNKPGQGDEFVYIRDLGSLYLESWAPRGGNKASVKVNEPIDFFFNGNVSPSSVNANTFQITRSNTSILGAFQVQNDTPTAGKSKVSWYPQVQNTNNGTNVYSVTSSSTILFPLNTYQFKVPGYARGEDPTDDSPPTIRPKDASIATGQTSTFELVHSEVLDGATDSTYRFTTGNGYYNDGQTPSLASATPTSGGTLPGPAATSGFSLTFNHSMDSSTVVWPSLTVTATHMAGTPIAGSTPVIAGTWSVTNVVNADGTSSATLTFRPHFKLPSGSSLAIANTSNLRGANGLSVASGTRATYAVSSFGRTSTSFTETFTNTTNADTSYNTASWGTDACAPGQLTGLQDGSTGPLGGADLTVTTANSPYQITATTSDFNNITVQPGATLRLRGSGPMTVRARGNIRIDGTVDFAGLEGASGSHGYAYYYYGPTYCPTSTSGSRTGGTGYNGGGSGGSSTNSNSDHQNGGNGGNGSGTSGTGGQGGQIQTSFTPRTTTYYYYGVGGGAGGGHARAGFEGLNASQYTTPRGPLATPGAAATALSDFSQGMTAGGGGGGGGMMLYSTTYCHSGGAGGAGAGAVLFMCDGTFTLSAAGYINGQGGQGGSSTHYSGAGGGGAGGGCWIKAGAGATIDGIIDLRGGRAGPRGMSYFSDTYAYYNATTYGTPRQGGDGAPGRLVVEAPNFIAAQTDQVRVFGALMVRRVTSLPTTSISTTTPSTTWQNGGTVDLNGVNDVRYSSLTVGTSTASVIKLRNGTNGSGGTNRAVRIWVNGDVTVNGQLHLNGNGCGLADSSSFLTSGDIAPLNSSNAYATMWGQTYVSGASTYTSGYYGVVGGGDGGRPMGNSTTNLYGYSGWQGFPGNGPAPGLNKYKQGNGWSGYEVGDAGGAGAGNAMPGRDGWCCYAAGTVWNCTGLVADSTGNGVSATTRATDSPKAGGQLNASTISTSTISSFVGSGGGAGNAGGYYYYSWMAATAHAGGGGGSVAIIAQGQITVNSGAAIEARGGDGNPPGMAYYPYYSHSAGGAGSGGTIYLVGDRVTIAAAASESQTSGATFNLMGGYGGGWRQPWTGTRNRYQWYNAYGGFGGDGGYGRLVVDYRTTLNGTATRALANRWGYEQSSFTDAAQQYRALAGQSTFKCRGTPGGNLFRSNFLDLGSYVPRVTSMTIGVMNTNTGYTYQGQGAQSHPHNAGAGTGTPDLGNVMTTPVTASASMGVEGWRWWRFQGSLSRLSSTGAAPVLDNVVIGYTTDN